MEIFVPIALITIALLYLLPCIVARLRKHKNTNAIAVLNIFLGWTFLGWVIALIWATTHQDKQSQLNQQPYYQTPTQSQDTAEISHEASNAYNFSKLRP